ncbi:uncharacterized protein LOC114300652 [Camellia sinensis]|uniref:uncharacterized protein LOC114300652 n=1 Tax=Camellia sinensis TaxID=4442 RepID=UPI001036BBBC|nr:uncharacterized protein LOC114300652 [Camellia sinensis]
MSFQMSLVNDSPVHSSNSKDFAAFLDAELNSIFDTSPDLDGEVEDKDDNEDDSKPNIERIGFPMLTMNVLNINVIFFNMTNFNPLSKILDDNRLTGSNYVNWKRYLTIVLTAEKLNHVLTTDPPALPEADATDEQREAVGKWHEADDVAKCYILASMTNVLQKQHKDVPTAKDMMVNLKEMFGEQSRSARQAAMKGLMSTKMVEDIDGETKIDAILSSLPDSYNQFILNYNMNKMIVAPSELLNMLQAAEDLIKKSQPTVMMGEKEGPRKFKPKG